uniref:Alpha-elapitoxin-As2a n=1 Tax=Austrelaps superbus TaxID=29156 RepID=3L22_AUSSU|nr:RecName: Full=Alpha-elapitoxin-As2a; Short=Alpha-EPTX-As2a; AltName: Full=Long neurotoxin 2; Short=LNTX-2; Flags: Precursor [Austrelaps superbus]ABW24176.1 LNTX-2 precursor [Austrelaps superbus]
MKTLLLTLVVVTIVCLDLGDGLICYVDSKTSRTCPPGENVCFTETWCDARCSLLGKRVDLGCAATCPTAKPGVDITCCSTDKCNPFPTQKHR